MPDHNEFKKYATRHAGISSLTMHQYASAYGNYISPTIIEERQFERSINGCFLAVDDG